MPYLLRAALLSLALHGLLVGVLWILPAKESRTGAPDLLSGDFTLVWDIDAAPGAETQEPVEPRLITIPLQSPQASLRPVTGPVVTLPSPSPVPAGQGSLVGPAGGTGQGRAPTSPPLPALKSPRSIVFLLDRSISMGLSGTLAPARTELRGLLENLPSTCRFQVIPYSRQAEPMSLRGSIGLVQADAAVVQAALARVDALPPEGGTEHLKALRRGLQFRAESLVLLTDGLNLPDTGIEEITRLNQGRSAIHILEVVRSRAVAMETQSTASLLAERNQGSHRRLYLP